MLGFDGKFTAVHPITKFFRFFGKKLQKMTSKTFHRKLGNLNKFPKMLGFDEEFPALHAKSKFRHFLVKNCSKSALKLSTRN